MPLNYFVCGVRSKALFAVLCLLSATSSFSMDEEEERSCPAAAAVSSSSSSSADVQAQLDRFNKRWQRGEVEVDEEQYRRTVLSRAAVTVAAREAEEEPEPKPLPEWLVTSCIKNMPPLLKGIHDYLQSGAIDDPDRSIPAFHRFLLVGPPGTSKSTTAEAIAQSVGYRKKIVGASSLLGQYRSHTAISIREMFKGLRAHVARTGIKTMLIINELHKLFEAHTNLHSDHAETAMCFWEQLDELERYDRHIVTAITANSVEKFPPELKSRFRGQWILMPKLNGEQLLRTFDEVIAADKSIRISDGVKDAIQVWCAGGKSYSYRDLQLLVATAKMFFYADRAKSASCMQLNKEHFERAIAQFADPEQVMKFEDKQIDEQEVRHREMLRHQDLIFVQQQLDKVKKESDLFDRYGFYLADESKITYQRNLDKLRQDLSEDQRVVLDELLQSKEKERERQDRKNLEEKERKEAEEAAKKKAEEEKKAQAAAKKKEADGCIVI